MEKIKKLPFFAKGIIVVTLTVLFVFAVTAGLRILEEKQQKPRVLKAIASLALEAEDERYSLKKFAAMLQNDRLIHNGRVTITELEEMLLPEQYRFLVPYISKSVTQLDLAKDAPEKQAEFQLDAQLQGLPRLYAEGYLDEEECAVRIPGLHESYLAFSPDNIRAQYQDSLLYTFLGDSLSLPEDNLTDYVFSERDTAVSGELETVSQGLADTLKLFKELYDEITVEKTKEKEEILWNGGYESCVAYRMILPSELVNHFLEAALRAGSGHSLSVKPEDLTLYVYLNSEKRLLKLETESSLVFDAREIPFLLSFYPKGVENSWDNVLLEAELTWEDIIYGFHLVCSNEFLQEQRVLHTSLSLSRPYVTKLLDIDAGFYETGAALFEFAAKTPVLSADGTWGIKALEEQLSKPTEKAVRVFELNLFDILKFMNGLNWSFFQKQE